MIDPTMSLYSQSSPASWSIVFPAGVCSDRLESAAYLPSASASCVLILFNERSFAIHAVNAISPEQSACAFIPDWSFLFFDDYVSGL